VEEAPGGERTKLLAAGARRRWRARGGRGWRRVVSAAAAGGQPRWSGDRCRTGAGAVELGGGRAVTAAVVAAHGRRGSRGGAATGAGPGRARRSGGTRAAVELAVRWSNREQTRRRNRTRG
jgi:hypothetical protein